MRILDHQTQTSEEWRAGVLTRMRVSALTGASQLCQFEQWCQPGVGAPTHQHAVEEILTVLEGEAEVWLDDERVTVRTGQSLVMPAGHPHGFVNSGTHVLHVQATIAAPIFEAAYDDKREVPRRYVPGW